MGVVIVESGWGSLIPTVVIANMSQFGAAARSGKLNIGDQVMSINGTSLVGLPLAQCQQMIKVRSCPQLDSCLTLNFWPTEKFASAHMRMLMPR